MSVQTTDSFLVQRGTTQYHVTAANANTVVQDADILLVQRGAIQYKITGAVFKSAAFQDGDLYIVNRAGVDYKATGALVKAILRKAPIIRTLVLAEDDAAHAAFTSQAFTATITMTEPGMPVATHNLKAWVEGNLKAGARLYLKFNAAGAVSDLQSADPGWVQTTNQATPKLTFPATFPSGKAPDTELPSGTTITVEAQATNAAGTVTKVSNIVTPARELKAGDAFGGGFYAGQIRDGGVIYNLIVAPRVSGSLLGEYSTDGGVAPAALKWKTSDTVSPGAAGAVYGAPAMVANNGTDHPAFHWCATSSTGPNAGTYDATNSRRTGIGGFNDWYIPAQYELEILFRHLKTTTDPNNLGGIAGGGTNPYAVPPTGYYTATDPAQTANPLFRAGGVQALASGGNYWSATDLGTVEAISQNFSIGTIFSLTKGANRAARAIRRVPA